ncbi:MAG: hypothetical protein QOD72_2451 [Acidimicrobiaceae bacterium]|jgi:hypothetical protein|nr:hypothetical protein [Acidimicrobiaceae bacterium]
MNHDDDELFSILERAIGPTSDDAPNEVERQQLRATVDDWREHRPVPITAAHSRRWMRRTVATGLGGIFVLSGATAVAAAVNDGVLPAPARSVARSIGLPVESSDLAKARAALGRLRKAGDGDRDALEVQVEDALSRLSASELAKINDAASATLGDAHDRDEQLTSNSGSGSGNSGSDSSGSGASGSSGLSGSSGSGSGSSGSGSSGSGSSGSGSSGDGSSGDGASESGSSGSGSSGSGGSGDQSTTSTTEKDDDHDAITSTSAATSTSTTEDHSLGGETSTTSTTSTTDGHHGGDGGGSGKDGGSGQG